MAAQLIYKRIDWCPITRQAASILYPYIDSNQSGWYNIYGGLHDGIDIVAKSVHSICQGVVLFIGQNMDNHKYEITVQYDADRCLRYCNIAVVYVNSGDAVIEGQLLGDVEDFVHFEYTSRPKNESVWPVRVGTQTYYKHDPEEYADGRITLLNSSLTDMTTITSADELPSIEITDSMLGEFDVDNRKDSVPNSV